MDPIWTWTARDVVDVEGPDAAAYLQGQLSQDVAGLAVGAAAATFVLAPQGKVDGWGRVQRVGSDAFRIDVDAGAGEAWDARLRRFLLRTKATIAVAPGVRTLAVRGVPAPDGQPGALPALGPDVIGFDVLHLDAAAPPTQPLPELVEADEAGLEALRIASGVPRWGAELDDDTIPATVGQWIIDASVSFTKGCYTGQELVARIDSRGGNVPRLLHGLVVDGPTPAVGAAVRVEGTDAGTVTSAAAWGAGAVALAFVPRAVEVGDGVAATVGDVAARLAPLPLAPPPGAAGDA